MIIAAVGVFALGWIVVELRQADPRPLGLLVIGFASTWVLRARRSAATQLAHLSAKTPA